MAKGTFSFWLGMSLIHVFSLTLGIASSRSPDVLQPIWVAGSVPYHVLHCNYDHWPEYNFRHHPGHILRAQDSQGTMYGNITGTVPTVYTYIEVMDTHFL